MVQASLRLRLTWITAGDKSASTGQRREVVTAKALEGVAETRPSRWRELVGEQFGRAEDIVYVALGVLLAVSAAALLISSAAALWKAIAQGTLLDGIVTLLDRMLLTLMVVELLYTVQVSFRAHALVPEPFLIIGLIAAVRRILVVTAAISARMEKGDHSYFQEGLIELGLLTAMVIAMVVSLRILQTAKARIS